MFRSVAGLLFSLIVLHGCGTNPTPAKLEPRFEATNQSQRAAFYTTSWVGGGGDPLLLSPGDHKTAHFDGWPVVLKSDAQEALRKHAGPQPNNGTVGVLLVDADIHLEESSTSVSTNPPSNRTIQKVVIERIHSAQWH